MSQESTSKFSLKISPKRIALFFIILIIPFAVYLLVLYVFPVYSWSYEGRQISFRANLREAQKVPIIYNGARPDGDFNVRDVLVRDDVRNISFLFKPTDDTNNTLYLLEESEIIKALTFAYLYNPKLQLNQIPTFNAQIVESYSNITATQVNPKIVLVHPNYGNETMIKQDGYIIYVQAKDTNNFDTDKIQFDLAAVRLMMAILNIKFQ